MLLTTEQLMKELNVKSKTTVYKMLKRGMPSVTVGDHKRFLFTDVIAWLKLQEEKHQ